MDKFDLISEQIKEIREDIRELRCDIRSLTKFKFKVYGMAAVIAAAITYSPKIISLLKLFSQS